MFTIKQVTSAISNVLAIKQARAQVWINKKGEAAVVAFTEYALSYNSVQRVIAHQMRSGGAMCRVLEDAVSDAVSQEDRDVDADHISGLEDAIEHQVERMSITVDADDVNDLDDKVAQILKDISRDEVEVLAENINDFNETVESVVENMTLEVDADNVKDLDDAISSAISDATISVDMVDGLEDKISEMMADMDLDTVVDAVLVKLVERLQPKQPLRAVK
jgi:hypothetical protein